MFIYGCNAYRTLRFDFTERFLTRRFMKEEVNYAKLSDFQPVAPTEQPVYANLEDGQPIYAKVGLSLHHRRFIPNAEKNFWFRLNTRKLGSGQPKRF